MSGTNKAPAGNPFNHGNTTNNKPFVLDDLTLNMIKVLCARKRIELEKINDIEYSKQDPSFTLNSCKVWRSFHGYTTQVYRQHAYQKSCLKNSKGFQTKELPTNRGFIGAGGQPLEPVGVFLYSLFWGTY
jgi:hypothetical protein